MLKGGAMMIGAQIVLRPKARGKEKRSPQKTGDPKAMQKKIKAMLSCRYRCRKPPVVLRLKARANVPLSMTLPAQDTAKVKATHSLTTDAVQVEAKEKCHTCQAGFLCRRKKG